MKVNSIFMVSLLGVLLLMLATVGAAPAHAQACTIPSTFATIRAAASSGSCSFITLTSGTYAESNIEVRANVTLQGAGSNVSIINANAGGRLFTIDAGATLVLANVQLSNGSADNGGAIVNNGTLTIQNSTLSNNQATQRGGAIYTTGQTTITNTTFTNNSATLGGGAIAHAAGDLVVMNGTYVGNKTPGSGAAIYINSGTLNVTNSLFKNNTSSNDGGAIWTSVPSTVSRSTFQSNRSGGNGGGIEMNNGSGPFNINNSTFISNQALFGGALDNQTGNVTLTNSTFSKNTATGGGVMNNDGGTLNVSGSTFDHNVATTDRDGGGAIWGSIPMYIVNSTFSQNRSNFGPGGAIDNDGNLLTLLNDTFVGNKAPRGGNLQSNTGVIHIQNTLLAGGKPNNCGTANGSAFISEGSNLSSDGSCAPFFRARGDMNNRAAKVGSLNWNGGPTKTQALLPSSPAINGVIDGCPPPYTDQRGISRPQGGRCDIGAYEFNH